MHLFENIFEVIDFLHFQTSGMISKRFTASNTFDLITINKDTFSLQPTGQFLHFYRGEADIYPRCIPNLFRNFRICNYLRNRLEQIEFEILLKHSPIINGDEQFNFEIRGKKLIYTLDFLALSQHFGIATEYLDLTNDLFIALYFATHKQYTPIYNGVGVIYYYMDVNYENLKTIGMQLFPRPGEQRAFALKLGIHEDLNKLKSVQKYFFKQTFEGTNFLSNLFRNGELLFPKDVITDKATAIKTKKEFSNQSLVEAHKRFFSNFDFALLQNKFEGMEIYFTDSNPTFSTAEITELVSYLSTFIEKLNHAGCRMCLYV